MKDIQGQNSSVPRKDSAQHAFQLRSCSLQVHPDELYLVNTYKYSKFCFEEPKVAKYHRKYCLQSESVKERDQGELQLEINGFYRGTGMNDRVPM